MSKFLYQGQTYGTAKEVQKALGGSIKMKDIIAGLVEGVSIVADDGGVPTTEEILTTVTEALATEDAEVAELVESTNEVIIPLDPTDEIVDNPNDTDDDFMATEPEHVTAAKARDKADELEVAKSKLLQPTGTTAPTVPTTGDIEYPEVGAFADKKAMKKYVKKLSLEQVFDWCDLEGVMFNPCDHEAINRMRAIMAMTDKHFPATAPATTKSKSKYADMSTEALVALAATKKVAVKDAKGNVKIQRMYTIMALKEAGHLA
jgi:hypothetical protein